MTTANDLREALAALAHERWAHATREALERADTSVPWKRAEMPYEALTEEEKEDARRWADQVLVLIHKNTITEDKREQTILRTLYGWMGVALDTLAVLEKNPQLENQVNANEQERLLYARKAATGLLGVRLSPNDEKRGAR